MSRFISLTFLLSLVCFLGITTAWCIPAVKAQDAWAEIMKAKTPGPQHKMLQELEGEWVVKTVMGGLPPSLGRTTWTSILGGRFVRGVTTGMMMGQPTISQELLGYDNTKKVYTSQSISTMSTGAMYAEGKQLGDGSIEYKGTIYEFPTPEGRPFRVVSKQTKDHYWVDVYDQQGPDREVKVVEIKAYRMVPLFNGKTLDGWDRVGMTPETDMSKTWSVKDGILHCAGNPAGYIRSKKSYSNYELEFEWSWQKGSNGGNSGLLVHTSSPNALGVWPKSLEVQLQSRSAGDFWQIKENINVDQQATRMKGRRIVRLGENAVERPIGQWNKMKVRCIDDEVVVWVNGKLVNQGRKCTATFGKISFQSEGTPISFRNIRLAEVGK